jgi:hypothetical protein
MRINRGFESFQQIRNMVTNHVGATDLVFSHGILLRQGKNEKDQFGVTWMALLPEQFEKSFILKASAQSPILMTLALSLRGGKERMLRATIWRPRVFHITPILLSQPN